MASKINDRLTRAVEAAQPQMVRESVVYLLPFRHLYELNEFDVSCRIEVHLWFL